MRLVNDLVSFEEKDYNYIIEDFVKSFSSEGITLFSFGSIKHPGISDLDLCVVFGEASTGEEDLHAVVRETENFRRKSKLHSYLLTHGIPVYPSDIFRYVKWLHSAHNLSLLSGKQLSLMEPNIQEKCFLQLSHFVNFAGYSLSWLHNILSARGNISLREALLSLGSARHSLIYFFKQEPEISETLHLETVISELSSLRKNYKDYDSGEMFSLVARTHHMLLNIAICFSNRLSSKYFHAKNNRSTYFLLLGKRLVKFADKIRDSEQKRLILPLVYLYQGASYARLGKGRYGRIHKILFPMYREIDVPHLVYKNILKKQIGLADVFAARYNKYNITPITPLCCFYRPHRLNNKTKCLGLFNKIVWKIFPVTAQFHRNFPTWKSV